MYNISEIGTIDSQLEISFCGSIIGYVRTSLNKNNIKFDIGFLEFSECINSLNRLVFDITLYLKRYYSVKTIVCSPKLNDVAFAYALEENGYQKLGGDWEYSTEKNVGESRFIYNKHNCFVTDVLFLTNNNNSILLFKWLKERTNVTLFSGKLSVEMIDIIKPKLIVSYNYSFLIQKPILDSVNRRAINLHTSLLPWNRGDSPNVWSFLEETPKGVTIHQIDEGIDTGKIIFQKELFFDSTKETFETSYILLHKEIMELFKAHWDEIWDWNCPFYSQHGAGTIHYSNELKELIEKNNFVYSENVDSARRRYLLYKGDQP